MKTLKYKRNWAYEATCDVFFVDGSSQTLPFQSNNKGQIIWIEIDGVHYTPEQFAALEITDVHFVTPASLEVKTPTNILVEVYLRLGKTIAEGDTMEKTRIRSRIADEIHKRGFNLHELMSEHSNDISFIADTEQIKQQREEDWKTILSK